MRKPQGTKFSAPVTIEARSDGWVNRDEITYIRMAVAADLS